MAPRKGNSKKNPGKGKDRKAPDDQDWTRDGKVTKPVAARKTP